MEISWIKLKTNMFADEKIRLIENMPERDTILIIWIRLLIQAGKCNANGHIFISKNIPFTDEVISTLFNRPLTTVRLALNKLRELDMISFNNESLFIENWEKHQNVEGMDKIREQNRLRQSRFRDKRISENKDVTLHNVTVTQQRERESKIKIKNKKESKSIPSLTEVLKYAKNKNYSTEVVNKFYNYYKSTNWKTKAGNKITDWKKGLDWWVKNEYNHSNIKNADEEEYPENKWAN